MTGDLHVHRNIAAPEVRPDHVVTVVLRPSPWFTVEVSCDGLKIDPAGHELTWDQAQLYKRHLEAALHFVHSMKMVTESEAEAAKLRNPEPQP